MVLVVVVEQVFWTPILRWRLENKEEEELLGTELYEGEALISCNRIQMIKNVVVALDWKSTRT